MLIAFFIVQWELYYTHNLVLWYANVTEAQFLAIAINIIAFINPDFYIQKTILFDTELTFGQVFTIPIAIVAVGTCLSSFYKVFILTINQSTERFVEAFLSLFPCFMTSIGFSIWCYLSPQLFSPNSYYISTTMGFVFGGLVGRLVVARVTQMKYDLYYYIMLPMPIGIINSLSPVKFINEQIFVQLYCFFSIAAYIHFALCIINYFTAYNGISCFGVKEWSKEEIARRRKELGIVREDEKKNN